MAINPLKVYWLERLHAQGHLEGKRTILDLGPQDLTTPEAVIRKIVSHRIDPAHLEETLSNIYAEDGHVRKGFQRHFYSLFGLEEYRSLDLNDDRADYRFDLNDMIELPRTFDVITNFGTSEHIFNIGHLYANVHRLLAPEGIALHINPSYGDINHGLYNIHPNLYSSLIRANSYRQLSLLYIDNYVGRNELLTNELSHSPDFDTLPIDLGSIYNGFGDMKELRAFRAKVYATFVANTKSPLARLIREDRGVFDYTFAALQKVSDTDFRTPQQYSSDAKLLPH